MSKNVNGKAWESEDNVLLLEMYSNNDSCDKIAKRLGQTQMRVKLALRSCISSLINSGKTKEEVAKLLNKTVEQLDLLKKMEYKITKTRKIKKEVLGEEKVNEKVDEKKEEMSSNYSEMNQKSDDMEIILRYYKNLSEIKQLYKTKLLTKSECESLTKKFTLK